MKIRTHRLNAVILAAAAVSVLVAALVAGGCAGGNPHPLGSYERGRYFVEKGKYVEAVDALESFVRHNPTDSLAAEAQFLKAMTIMEQKEFPLAAVEFQILRKDYPTSDRVEESYFREGVAYFRQVGRVERDVTGAHDARAHFLEFATKYPQSSHLPAVKTFLLDISDLMVRKRLRQCRVFRQLHRPQAVALALDTLLAEESGSRLLDKVLSERAKNAARLDDPATAAAMYRRLVADYPDSPRVDEARSYLASEGADGSTAEDDDS